MLYNTLKVRAIKTTVLLKIFIQKFSLQTNVVESFRVTLYMIYGLYVQKVMFYK